MRFETRTICAECGVEFDTYEPVRICPECVKSPENELDYQKRMALAYQAEAKDLRAALAERDALCADVELARNLRRATAAGHVQCGPGKDGKTFAAAKLANPNLIGVEIIRGQCAWADTLDAALAELAAKLGGTQ